MQSARCRNTKLAQSFIDASAVAAQPSKPTSPNRSLRWSPAVSNQHRTVSSEQFVRRRWPPTLRKHRTSATDALYDARSLSIAARKEEVSQKDCRTMVNLHSQVAVVDVGIRNFDDHNQLLGRPKQCCKLSNDQFLLKISPPGVDGTHTISHSHKCRPGGQMSSASDINLSSLLLVNCCRRFRVRRPRLSNDIVYPSHRRYI